MRRFRYGILLALCLLLPMAALADDSEETRRRIVYVPQDQLDVLVEKHGQGVVLGVEEYLKLWAAAERAGLPRFPTTGYLGNDIKLAHIIRYLQGCLYYLYQHFPVKIIFQTMPAIDAEFSHPRTNPDFSHSCLPSPGRVIFYLVTHFKLAPPALT